MDNSSHHIRKTQGMLRNGLGISHQQPARKVNQIGYFLNFEGMDGGSVDIHKTHLTNSRAIRFSQVMFCKILTWMDHFFYMLLRTSSVDYAKY